MKPGSEVIYVADPMLYGRMVVSEVRKDGRVSCWVDPDTRHCREVEPPFHAHELELAPALVAA
jgi:uncharacterized protein YodC (DUF2158 family)